MAKRLWQSDRLIKAEGLRLESLGDEEEDTGSPMIVRIAKVWARRYFLYHVVH